MFIKSSLITLALVISASATPVADIGTPVAFEKRNPLTKENGWFDMDRARVQVSLDRNKHRANIINLERNLGHEALNQGAKVIPIDSELQPEKRQAESLIDEDSDTYWAGNIGIGTPSNPFLLNFDTGSADLWVPSINCTASACANKHKYSALASSTSTRRPDTFTIAYGDGSSVSGPIFTDTVSVAGVTARAQYFSAVESLSSSFASEAADGILGLAFPAISNLRQSPFVNSALSQGAIKNGVFAFKLAKSGSELYLGGTNSKLYTGAIEPHKVTGSGFWQISNASLLVGSKTTQSGFQTIIDSGTTIIYGPPMAVATFYSSIPDAQLQDEQLGFYSFPCASTPANVAFNWGGKNWVISAANFNLGKISQTRCMGAIAGQNLGLGSNVWLLGDSFMKNVYSVFSFDQNTVGFAQLQ